MALSSWRASIVQSIRVARGFLWLIASKRSLTSRESWPQTQASFKSRFHKVLWISHVVSPVLYCSYLCINQGPWFASLHICPPHFKAMQDLFVSVDESPWMWDTEKHVNICQLHTGGGEQTEQWYCFFFLAGCSIHRCCCCVLLLSALFWSFFRHGGKAEDAGSASCTSPSIAGGMYSARFQATKMQQKVSLQTGENRCRLRMSSEWPPHWLSDDKTLA